MHCGGSMERTDQMTEELRCSGNFLIINSTSVPHISHGADETAVFLVLFFYRADRVNVVLMENKKETKCYGEVHIKKNRAISPVCSSGWGPNESEMVCKELNCGEVSQIYPLLKINKCTERLRQVHAGYDEFSHRKNKTKKEKITNSEQSIFHFSNFWSLN